MKEISPLENIESHLVVLTLRTQIITQLTETASKLDINQPEVLTKKADTLWGWVTQILKDEKKGTPGA